MIALSTTLQRDWFLPPPPPPRGLTHRIIAEVAASEGVEVDEILSPHRMSRHVSQARQLAMWLSRELTKLSLPEIGRIFGRDHTTVLSGVRAAQKRIDAEGLHDHVAVIGLRAGAAIKRAGGVAPPADPTTAKRGE